MRALMLLALIAVVVLVVTRLPSGWRARLPSPGERSSDELVKDPVCQTYVLMSRAIRSESMIHAPHCTSRAATIDLPDPIPPVSPTLSIGGW